MSSKILRFGDFELDRNLYELRCSGRPLKLERIPLDLLFLLVERRDYLVSREEIVERIWGKRVFLDTDSAIKLGRAQASPRTARGSRYAAVHSHRSHQGLSLPRRSEPTAIASR